MIVTDLDRTLLWTDKTLSDFTVSVFKKCISLGIKIVFATARPKRSVTEYQAKIKCNGVVYHNGAVVYFNDKEINKTGIDYITAKNILFNIAKDIPDATLSIEINDTLYANFDTSTLWKYTTAITSDFTDLPAINADKIIVGASSAKEIEILEKYLSDDLYIELADNKLGLIMHKQATKMNGILHICDKCNIPISEIIAFGDDYNDIEMIKKCGIGVAMSNAIDEVKNASDYVCDTNDNDGVAKWLNEHLLFSL